MIPAGVQLYGPNGTLQMTNTHAYTRLTTPQRWVAPAAAIPMPLPRVNFIKGPAPASAKIWVDLVLFPNGTTWGPNRLGRAARWKAIHEGVKMEQAHLQRVLHRTGAKGVATALAAH